MAASDGDGSERVRAHRAQLQALSDKMARLRSRVGQLQDAVQELHAAQSDAAGQVDRATSAVQQVIQVAETTARRQSTAPPAVAGEELATPRQLPPGTPPARD